jgi:dTDP-4-dehydrorhamnose reductase
MTRILILGVSGMLGHVLWRQCADHLDAWGTVRGAADVAPGLADGARAERILGNVVAEDTESLATALERSSPDVAVNCVGIVKQSGEAKDAARMIEVNSLYPHRLARACEERGVRLIHVSTDCVFSGRRGGYDESELPDPADLYGRSKLAGEPEGPGVLTLRTSMIGWELSTQRGLLEWLVSQEGETVTGFRRALFSGPTAAELARLIARIADDHSALEGTLHLGAEPISKYDLLLKLREALGLRIEIVGADEPRIDRSLDSSRLREATGWEPPSWDEMAAELARERHDRQAA